MSTVQPAFLCLHFMQVFYRPELRPVGRNGPGGTGKEAPDGVVHHRLSRRIGDAEEVDKEIVKGEGYSGSIPAFLQ